jgi:hypothetical protein
MNRPKLSAGGPVQAQGGLYITRHSDNMIYDYLRNGEYCSILSSRMTGKTSSIYEVKSRLEEEGIRTAYIDIAGHIGGQESSEVWYKNICFVLSRRLKGTSKNSAFNGTDQLRLLARRAQLETDFPR